MSEWLPNSVVELRHYSTKTFVSDVKTGVSVALVTLPLAMAISIASGVLPQAGLYCAIVAGFIGSALSGSATQICGPTAAFVVLISEIGARRGIDGISMCTLMAGVILVFLGATGLGTAVKFIPPPVVVGFRNGIVVVVASTQLKDFFGIKVANVPVEFWARIEVLVKHFHVLSPAETSLSVIALTLIIFFLRYVSSVPGYVVALFSCTVLSRIFKLPVETIAMRFGGIPSGLPLIPISHPRLVLLPSLLSPAIAVATLSAIVSLTPSVVSDRMRAGKTDSNLKLVGQGIANALSALFGGLPAAWTVVGTETNIASGGKPPLTGILHALVLLVLVVFAAPLAGFIPLSVLAAVFLAATWRMGEWHKIPELLRLSKLEIGVWLTTCLLTIFADLTVAVEVGMILALLMSIRKVTSTPVLAIVRKRQIEEGHTIQ